MPISFSTHLPKTKKPKKVHKRRHSRTVAVKDLRGNYQGKDILQTPGKNWGGGDTDTTTTLFYKHCSEGKTLKRTDRSESA